VEGQTSGRRSSSLGYPTSNKTENVLCSAGQANHHYSRVPLSSFRYCIVIRGHPSSQAKSHFSPNLRWPRLFRTIVCPNPAILHVHSSKILHRPQLHARSATDLFGFHIDCRQLILQWCCLGIWSSVVPSWLHGIIPSRWSQFFLALINFRGESAISDAK
jgi:hypothetical protein